MSQRLVSESVSDEDTAAVAEVVVVLKNSLLEIVDIENCLPKRKNWKTTTETETQRPPTVTSTPGKAEALLGLRMRKTYFTLAFDLEPADLTDRLAFPTLMSMDMGPGPTSKESAISGTTSLKKRKKK
ncbi:hypothetical protein RYX36_025490 [Vicia faba]